MIDAVDGLYALQHNYVRQRLNLMLIFLILQVNTLQTHLKFYAVNYQVKRMFAMDMMRERH